MSEIPATPPESFRVFAYATTEKASLYRAIMRVFMESKQQFVFRLRPREILERIAATGFVPPVDLAEIDSALSQLSEWGNLMTLPDTGDVTTVEDFYKQRYFFQLTSEGEAAQRALDSFESAKDRSGELRRSDLAEIRIILRELNVLSKSQELDSGEVHRRLLAMRSRFEILVDSAQKFMGTLQRNIDQQTRDDNESILRKQRIIEYLQQFVGELVIAGDEIAHAVREIEGPGIDRLLRSAAERSVLNQIDALPEDLNCAFEEWHSMWNRFRDWFISRPGRLSSADILRTHARESIPALLNVITSINDRLITRIDRSNDLRVLARWFMEASEADAHRLWRAAFALGPSRHLIINDSTLDNHETQSVLPDTSWLDAPPLSLSPRARGGGSQWRGGRLSRIIDRTAEKQKLAAATYEEALRILRAQNRFVAGTRMRLSELELFEADEFDLLLEFLGESAVDNGDASEILSSDGSLKVRLEPTRDGRIAAIQTSEGVFAGPDQWITVERNVPEEIVS